MDEIAGLRERLFDIMLRRDLSQAYRAKSLRRTRVESGWADNVNGVIFGHDGIPRGRSSFALGRQATVCNDDTLCPSNNWMERPMFPRIDRLQIRLPQPTKANRTRVGNAKEQRVWRHD
jgi:hypothetical protein